MNSNFYKFLAIFLIFFTQSSSGFSMQVTSDLGSKNLPAIIPAPQHIEWGTEYFILPQKNSISYDSKSKNSAEWIKKLLSAAQYDVALEVGNGTGIWNLQINKMLQKDLGEEGYKLQVNASGIHIKSATEAGLFYGIQTIRQFFPAEVETGNLDSDIRLRFVEITDKPQFLWRGSMLDIARSFLSKEYIKAHIDRMALYKLNRLHLHLSDDQGWRLEIKKYPKLSEIGGKGAVMNGRSGFLTQQEFKALQEYAARRNIVIIPEIDMPGHIYAALSAYPELNCENNKNIDPKLALPPNPYKGYRVGWSKFCLENPATYKFVDDIIKELAEITKGNWIHIGGDEIEDSLYREFIVKIDAIVHKYGKTPIGWEESAKANLTEDFLVQRWNGQTKIGENQKIIDSFCKFFYLDHGNVPDQENTYKWCSEDGLSLEKVYSYKTDDARVVGIEAPVWSELVISDDRADDRLWPRSIAIAEIGWTNNSKRNFKNFTERLAKHSKRLDELGINYFKSPEVEWDIAARKGVFSDELIKEEKNE
jgi:hexosaminidase